MHSAQAVQQAFAHIGYALIIRAHPTDPLSGDLVVSGNGLAEMVISATTEVSRAVYYRHTAMFNLAICLKGHRVDGIKIC